MPYSPLKFVNIGQRDKVETIGIGRLGHMAVKITKAIGANVTAINLREENRQAVNELGSASVLAYENDLKNHENAFNFMLCTFSYPFDII